MADKCMNRNDEHFEELLNSATEESLRSVLSHLASQYPEAATIIMNYVQKRAKIHRTRSVSLELIPQQPMIEV
jgi:hypothetical protein